MRGRILFAALGLLGVLTAPARAQILINGVPPTTLDTSVLATKAEVAVVQANACAPASTVPPMEAVTASAGSASDCRRADAVQPRISRTGSCTLAANGACSGSWDGGNFPAGATVHPVGDPTPVNAGAQPITCNYTATPTVSGFALKCWTGQSSVLSLSLVTTGTTVLPFATPAAGIVVKATAIPTS